MRAQVEVIPPLKQEQSMICKGTHGNNFRGSLVLFRAQAVQLKAIPTSSGDKLRDPQPVEE
jgi:hypothetical protein